MRAQVQMCQISGYKTITSAFRFNKAIFKNISEAPRFVGLYKKKYVAAHVNSVYNFSRENDIISMTASATAAVVLLSITICSFAYSN